MLLLPLLSSLAASLPSLSSFQPKPNKSYFAVGIEWLFGFSFDAIAAFIDATISQSQFRYGKYQHFGQRNKKYTQTHSHNKNERNCCLFGVVCICCLDAYKKYITYDCWLMWRFASGITHVSHKGFNMFKSEASATSMAHHQHWNKDKFLLGRSIASQLNCLYATRCVLSRFCEWPLCACVCVCVSLFVLELGCHF